MVCMLHTFVYNAVNVNVISLLSYPYAQVSTRLKLYRRYFCQSMVHMLKPNPNNADYCFMNATASSFFSV